VKNKPKSQVLPPGFGLRPFSGAFSIAPDTRTTPITVRHRDFVILSSFVPRNWAFNGNAPPWVDASFR
jgi:hypothetical protein